MILESLFAVISFTAGSPLQYVGSVEDFASDSMEPGEPYTCSSELFELDDIEYNEVSLDVLPLQEPIILPALRGPAMFIASLDGSCPDNRLQNTVDRGQPVERRIEYQLLPYLKNNQGRGAGSIMQRWAGLEFQYVCAPKKIVEVFKASCGNIEADTIRVTEMDWTIRSQHQPAGYGRGEVHGYINTSFLQTRTSYKCFTPDCGNSSGNACGGPSVSSPNNDGMPAQTLEVKQAEFSPYYQWDRARQFNAKETRSREFSSTFVPPEDACSSPPIPNYAAANAICASEEQQHGNQPGFDCEVFGATVSGWINVQTCRHNGPIYNRYGSCL